jgi:hypothetical protein
MVERLRHLQVAQGGDLGELGVDFAAWARLARAGLDGDLNRRAIGS